MIRQCTSTFNTEEIRKPLAVIKYGGHSMENVQLNTAFAQNIGISQKKGWQILIGHGGGPAINTLFKKMGIESVFKNGLRVTSAEAMKVVEMALAGDVNTWLVSLLCENGINAVGLTGKDCATLCAEKNDDKELGFVGKVVKVNTHLCQTLIENSYIPVVAPIGFGPDSISLNINADTATGSLAGALCADIFLLVTDVVGVLDKDKNRFKHLTKSKIHDLIQDETIAGGMIPKVESCLHALSQGCKASLIIDGDSMVNLESILDILKDALQKIDLDLKNGIDKVDTSAFTKIISALSSGTLITR